MLPIATRFDMPFIICVRLTDKAGILAAMEHRLGNDPQCRNRHRHRPDWRRSCGLRLVDDDRERE